METLEFPRTIKWECVDGDHEWIGTHVSFELEVNNDTIILRFSHLGWTEESDFLSFCSYQWVDF